MEKKYELTDETRVWKYHTLHRIRALKDFSDVKAGYIGGWIESEENLSQEGDCWVYHDAKVFMDSKVSDNAKVFGNAEVYECAAVYENAWVYGNAQVHGQAKVYGYAKVYWHSQVYGYAKVCREAEVHGNAKVSGNAWVKENAVVFGEAQVYGKAEVKGNAWVYGAAKVYGEAEVSGNAKVYGNAKVCGYTSLSDYAKVHNIADKYSLSRDINCSIGLKWKPIDFSFFNRKYSGFSEIQMIDCNDNGSSIIKVLLKDKEIPFVFRVVFSDVSIFEKNNVCFIQYNAKCYLKDKKENYNRAFEIAEKLERHEISIKDAIDIIKDKTDKKFKDFVSKNTLCFNDYSSLESKIRNYVEKRINGKLSTIIDDYYTQS